MRGTAPSSTFDALTPFLGPWLRATPPDEVERCRQADPGQASPALVLTAFVIDDRRATSSIRSLMLREVMAQAERLRVDRILATMPAGSPVALVVAALGYEPIAADSSRYVLERRAARGGMFEESLTSPRDRPHTGGLADAELCRQVKHALGSLFRADELGRSPLLRLSCLSDPGDSTEALRALLLAGIADSRAHPPSRGASAARCFATRTCAAWGATS